MGVISLYKTLELKKNGLEAERASLQNVYDKQFFLFKNKLLKEKIDILTGKIKQLEEVLLMIQSNSNKSLGNLKSKEGN